MSGDVGLAIAACVYGLVAVGVGGAASEKQGNGLVRSLALAVLWPPIALIILGDLFFQSLYKYLDKR